MTSYISRGKVCFVQKFLMIYLYCGVYFVAVLTDISSFRDPICEESVRYVFEP